MDLERYIRHEATTGAGYEPADLEWSFDALMIDGVAVSGRVDRIDVDGNRAIVRDYKGQTVYPGANWAEDGRIQAALYALAVREQFGLDIAGALYQPIGSADQRPRGLVRDDVPGRYVNGDVVDERVSGSDAARRRARSRRRPPPTCAPAASALPGPLRVQRRLRPSGDLPLMRFTPEQRAAIAARTGSSLLAANAGSGKTAVMVERIAAAVREDGVAVGAILALTFTEKAAGELAERLRRRLTELGEHEHARAVDGAWIGTIHGFCARLLRSQPLAAGLDPRFEVLEETRRRAARERRLRARARGLGARRGCGRDRPRRLVRRRAARARPGRLLDAARPRARPPPARDPARAAGARPRRAGRGRAKRPRATWPPPATACAWRRREPRWTRAQSCSARRPRAAAVRRLRFPGRARWLPPSSRAALGAHHRAVRGLPRARGSRTAPPAPTTTRSTALTLIDALLARFGAEFAQAKRERAAVDFDDLELRAKRPARRPGDPRKDGRSGSR